MTYSKDIRKNNYGVQKMKRRSLLTLSAGLLAGSLTVSGLAVADAKDYVLNTASTGGTYHPVGTAIATLSKVKLLPKQKFSLTAVNSAGSGANVQAMGAGTLISRFLQGLYGSYAATGTGPISDPQKNLRSVTMLWQNVEQFVVANSAVKNGTVSDMLALKGQGAGMGAKNSGTLGSTRS
jgi:TRAP transporter TAXI family solute receptor